MGDRVLAVAVVLAALVAPAVGLAQIEFDGFEQAPADLQPQTPLSDQELTLPGDGDIDVEPDDPPSPDPGDPGNGEQAEPEPQPSDPGGSGETGVIVARDDRTQARPGVLVRINYTQNDTYTELAELAGDPQGGNGVVVSVGGLGAHFLYTPAETAVVGTEDSFTYTVCSTETPGTCDSATVTVVIASDGDSVPDTANGVVAERGGGGRQVPAACQQQLRWNGHNNGRIPDDAMRSIGGGHRLKEDAARAFEAMRSAAAAAAESVTIGLTDSYRSYAAQKAVRASKGDRVATATPGTSVHGWGKALDLKVRPPGVQAWLEQHSRDYAWINPPWAKRPGKSYEPWHYEFYGANVDPDNPQCAGVGSALTAATGGGDPAAAATGPEVDIGGGSVTPAGMIQPVGLGLGALAALISAGLIFVRDVQRARVIRDRSPQ